MILNEEALFLVGQRFVRRIERVNREMLSVLGKRIREIGQLSSTDAYVLANSVEMGADINKITQELAKSTEKNIQDIYPLYDEIARKNVRFAEVLYKYRDLKYVPYTENLRLQQQVKAWGDATANTFINISRTSGFSLPDYTGNKVWYKLASGYQHAIDQAVLSTSIGMNYSDQMYKVIKNMSASGIRTIDYPSGYSRRLDSSVRMNLEEGVRRVNQGVQDQIGEEVGSDGVEISAHALCAEDHLSCQGRQYTKEKYEELNNRLERAIGTLNCKHFAYSILFGVSSPSFSKSLLKQYKDNSLEKVKWQGKTYTRYEMTQLQRKYETAIRRQKDLQIIAKESNNKKGIEKAQQNITELTKEYKQLSNTASLRAEMERMRVASYKRVSSVS
jgi:hypothetical protein